MIAVLHYKTTNSHFDEHNSLKFKIYENGCVSQPFEAHVLTDEAMLLLYTNMQTTGANEYLRTKLKQFTWFNENN